MGLGLPVLAVALAARLRWRLDPVLGEHHPFVLFLAAVLVAARYGGWTAGALALGLGLLAADFLFVHPRHSVLEMGAEQWVGMAAYAGVGGVVILLVERLDRAKAELEGRVEQRTAERDATAGHLRHTEARARRLAALVESAEDAIVGKDLGGLITDWNAGAEHLFGYTAAEVVGRPADRLVPADRRDELARTADRVRRGEGVPPYETVRLRKGGGEVPVSVRVSPIRDGGAVVGYASISRDLTHARRLEAQLQQSQKMEAVGQLAGGIAHDFNNLLTVINGYTDLLLTDRPPGDRTRPLLEQVHEAGRRAAALTHQLLAFSRKQVLQPREVDLSETVRGAEQLLRRLIGEDVILTCELAPGLGRVKVDPGQFEQVVLNLAVNARDAMPRGGRLAIETADVELDAAYAAARPEAWPGRYVRLTVADTGEGMDEETRARLFEPFFTTKGPGRGTGLGLAVVHGIVAQSGGHIAVDSAPGRGTTFRVYLPAVEGLRETTNPPSGVGPPLPRGAETVLLVEDEESVRRLARTVLEGAGYTVLEAGHGGEAVRVAETYERPIHLLVSDVVMPEMGGRVLAERLAVREVSWLGLRGTPNQVACRQVATLEVHLGSNGERFLNTQ